MTVNYIIIRGPLGVGKSSISNKLGEILDAEYISIDRIVDDPGLIEKEKENGYRSQNNFFEANRIAVERVKEALESGKKVIFDGNFYWKSAIEDLEKRLKDYEGKIFTLYSPIEVCIERDNERGKTHGEDAARAVYKKSTSFEYGIKIDTTNKTIDETVEDIIVYLD